jgi:hypothetical protein
VFVLYGPAGSGKSTTLFELVQLAKALGVAVLYIPNGEEEKNSRQQQQLHADFVVPGSALTGQDFDCTEGGRAEKAWKALLSKFETDIGFRAKAEAPATEVFTDLFAAMLDIHQKEQ